MGPSPDVAVTQSMLVTLAALLTTFGVIDDRLLTRVTYDGLLRRVSYGFYYDRLLFCTSTSFQRRVSYRFRAN